MTQREINELMSKVREIIDISNEIFGEDVPFNIHITVSANEGVDEDSPLSFTSNLNRWEEPDCEFENFVPSWLDPQLAKLFAEEVESEEGDCPWEALFNDIGTKIGKW